MSILQYLLVPSEKKELSSKDNRECIQKVLTITKNLTLYISKPLWKIDKLSSQYNRECIHIRSFNNKNNLPLETWTPHQKWQLSYDPEVTGNAYKFEQYILKPHLKMAIP